MAILADDFFVGPFFKGGWLANKFTGLEGKALNSLGVDLMNAHMDAVDYDFKNNIGIPGLLSPKQAATYHHEVFATHELWLGQFGGTLLNSSPNFMRSMWCTGCDHAGSKIR